MRVFEKALELMMKMHKNLKIEDKKLKSKIKNEFMAHMAKIPQNACQKK